MPEQKDNFKKKLLFHLGISFLIVFVLGVILIFLGQDINKRISNISKFRQDIAIHNQKSESLISLKTGSEKANRYIDILGNIVPNDEGLIFLEREVNKLAKDDSVDLDFKFSEELKGTEGQVGGISFSMTARSSFSSTVKFLSDFENMRYFFELNRFGITREGETFKLSSEGKAFARL
jgi:hypothetical protein